MVAQRKSKCHIVRSCRKSATYHLHEKIYLAISTSFSNKRSLAFFFYSLTNHLEADYAVQIVLSQSFFSKPGKAVKVNNLQTFGGILDLNFPQCLLYMKINTDYIRLFGNLGASLCFPYQPDAYLSCRKHLKKKNNINKCKQ